LRVAKSRTNTTLATKAPFHSKTTSDDPQAALAAYVSEVKFDKPGTYHFTCSIHPRMVGTIVVQ